MRIAVLDLGTNTFHLHIADVSKSGVENVFKKTIAVKLGEGGINKGYITAAAFDRGIKALKTFREAIEKYQPEKVNAVATEAMRKASNGPQFISSVKNETGIEIQLISGLQEAEYIFEGVKAAVNLTGDSLIMDIGGGSTEFILCSKTEIFWKKSYPLGAAKLMEQFHHSDPISMVDQSAIEAHLGELLEDLFGQVQQYKPEVLIGSAGAFETFAELIEKGELAKAKTEYSFNLADYKKISDWLLKSTHGEREENKLIPPVRKDMIVAATVVTNYILRKTSLKKMSYSAFSLKEGILHSELKRI